MRRRSRGARSPSPPPRASSHARYVESGSHREDYLRAASRELPPERPYSYKVLCVSAIHPKASDEIVKDTLYREYKKFGDFSIRIAHELDERVAFVCFRSSEDARDAKHAKPRIILYDKVAIVEPVYERPETYRRPRSITPPDYDRYYARSPGPERHGPLERYERVYGPPVGLPPHRELRREAIPPPHHDFVRPPMHHGGPPHPGHHPGGPPGHHYGPPRHMMIRHPVHGFERVENKKDKFPNYLHHVQPEDDPLATRTLFAGNLEINISEEELRRIFSKYGIVDDIDIKRPPPGTGNAYAFVRFQTLDMAHRCKVELSGQYIGKFQCKIGYGKATPTTRIWVGGLGPWTSEPQLEREFDRFGAIKKIDYIKGDSNGYILYDSIDAAQAAVKEMRGFPLGGPDRRLRVDFADVTPGFGFKPRSYPEEGATNEFRARPPLDYDASPYDGYAAESEFSYGPRGGGGFRGRGSSGGASWHERRGGGRGGGSSASYRGAYQEGGYVRDEADWPSRRPPPELEYETPRGLRRSLSREPGVDRSRSRSPRRRPMDSDSDSETARTGMLSTSRTLTEVARKSIAVWQGALILKNSLFPAKFHLTDGDTDIIEALMKDEEGKHMLRITQRLRLDQPKLDDVSKRIQTSSSHAIFLGLAGSSAAITNDDANVQTRPLRNLVSYLKQKEAAGVISLLNKDTEGTGVLYAFPPCAFSTELLKRTCPSLSDEGLKEDHLVIVVVKGGSA